MSEAKAKIAPDIEKYQTTRSATGSSSKHSGDVIALGLAGATLEEVYDVLAHIINANPRELVKKYAHLNPGQQRMNLGNRIRGAIKAANLVKEGSGDKLFAEIAKKLQVVVKERAEAEAAARKKVNDAKVTKMADAKARIADAKAKPNKAPVKAAEAPAKAKPAASSKTAPAKSARK